MGLSWTFFMRRLVRYSRYYATNLFGLTIAFGTLMLIFQFVSFELSYDKGWSKDIYRVIHSKYLGEERTHYSPVTYSAVGPAMAADLPEILQQSRYFPFGNAVANYQGNAININRCTAVEASFFDMFDMKFIAGDPELSFDGPNEIILTRTTAIGLFGDLESFDTIIDTRVKLDNEADPYIVKGVVEPLPINAHLDYDLFLSYTCIIDRWQFREAHFDWNILDFRHYMEVAPGTDLDLLGEKIASFRDNYVDPIPGETERFELQHVEDIYLGDTSLQYDVAKGDRELIYMLLLIGLVLFIISWVNYINLSGALSIEQAKTTGLQRILGARPSFISTQLAMDALITMAMALVMGFVLASMATIALKELDFSIYSWAELWRMKAIHQSLLIVMMMVILYHCLLAWGILDLSSRKNRLAEVIRLKGASKPGGKRNLGKILLGFQFTLSIVAMVLGVIVYRQHQHLVEAPLGLELDDRWVISQPKLTPTDSTFIPRLAGFKAALESRAGISKVTSNQRTPGQQLQIAHDARFKGETYAFGYIGVDERYLDAYSLPLLAGRNFRRGEVGTRFDEVSQVIINRRALRALGISQPSMAIGQHIDLMGRSKEIVGVIENFRQRSLEHDYAPIALIPAISSNFQIAFHTSSAPTAFIDHVRANYELFFPGNSFHYRDLQAEYFEAYDRIQAGNQALALFCLIAILLSVLGMISLATLDLLSRFKEFGIRKVLGATSLSIYLRVFRNYGRYIFIAATLGTPIAVYLSLRWLQGFESRIGLHPLDFLVPIMFLAMLVIGALYIISRRAVHQNPVDSLRTE